MSIGPGRGVSAMVRFENGNYVGESFVCFDGMTWPRADSRASELDWRLRYGKPSKSDLLMAASIISAYEALVAKPSRERARIVRMLRDAQLILPVPDRDDATQPAATDTAGGSDGEQG